MQLIFIGCADHCIIDQRSNRISLFNLVEDFNAVSFPAVQLAFTVLVIATRMPNEPAHQTGDLTISIGPQQILNVPVEFNFQTLNRTRIVTEFQGLPLSNPGTLEVVVRVAGQVFGSWQAPVNSRGPVQAAPPAPAPAATNTQTAPFTTSPRKVAKKKRKR
jgi:hypothetical protein